MTAALTFVVGQRYATREGAIIRITDISSVHPAYPFLVGVIERYADGSVPDGIVKMSFCPDGRRSSFREHYDDLVTDLEAMG